MKNKQLRVMAVELFDSVPLGINSKSVSKGEEVYLSGCVDNVFTSHTVFHKFLISASYEEHNMCEQTEWSTFNIS